MARIATFYEQYVAGQLLHQEALQAAHERRIAAMSDAEFERYQAS